MGVEDAKIKVPMDDMIQVFYNEVIWPKYSTLQHWGSMDKLKLQIEKPGLMSNKPLLPWLVSF
jgi:hypothetical protein